MVTEEKLIRLFVEHESEFRGFARSLMLDPEAADDLLQEAYIAMWRKFETLNSESAFRSWAYSYIRLTALNLRRKKQRSPLVFSEKMMEVLADEWEEHADLADAKREALAGCVKELTERQRNLLGMYYGASKTTAGDLGTQLQRPVEGIYKALGRIRGILRVCINDKLEADGFSQ